MIVCTRREIWSYVDAITFKGKYNLQEERCLSFPDMIYMGDENHRVSKTVKYPFTLVRPRGYFPSNRNARSEMRSLLSLDLDTSIPRENNRDIRVQRVWYAAITRNNKIHLFCGEKERDPRYALFSFSFFFFAFHVSIIHPVLDN